MIKPEELRIGNIARVGDKVGKVTDIHTNPDELYFDFSPDYEYLPEYADPIPLAHETLKAAGFQPDTIRGPGALWRLDVVAGPWSLVNQIVLQQVDKCDSYLFALRSDNGLVYCRPVDALHSLQNAIYALTGQEITVNMQQPA